MPVITMKMAHDFSFDRTLMTQIKLILAVPIAIGVISGNLPDQRYLRSNLLNADFCRTPNENGPVPAFEKV